MRKPLTPEQHERKLAYMRVYRSANRDREVERCRKWYAENRESALKQQRIYTKAHPEVNKASRDKYRAKKRKYPAWMASEAARMQAWRNKDRPAWLAKTREYRRKKRETDVNFRIVCRLRARLQKKLKCLGIRKRKNTMWLTGCDVQFLRGYLEARFLPGMTWDNFGDWVIDHHIPCAEFDLRDPDQQRQCFSYTNLRPMWAADNAKKRDIVPPTHQAELI